MKRGNKLLIVGVLFSLVLVCSVVYALTFEIDLSTKARVPNSDLTSSNAVYIDYDCPTGFLPIGMQVKEYIAYLNNYPDATDGVTVICGKYKYEGGRFYVSQNVLSDDVKVVQNRDISAAKGSDNANFYCKINEMMVGIAYKHVQPSEDWADSYTPICRGFGADGNLIGESYIKLIDDLTDNTGPYKQFECRGDEVLIGISVKEGREDDSTKDWSDGATAFCADYSVVGVEDPNLCGAGDGCVVGCTPVDPDCSEIVTHECSSPDQTIMRLSGDTNAHAGLWNSNLPISICYDEVFGEPFVGEGIRECGGTQSLDGNQIIRLNEETNAHGASAPASSGYLDQICYGDLTCRKTSINLGCDEGYEQIISYSGGDNAHFSLSNDYNYIVCCSPGGEPLPDPICGNGRIDPGETCDVGLVDGFGDLGCSSFDAFDDEGSLVCTDDCFIDTSDCTGGVEEGVCGDGVVNPGETCDGNPDDELLYDWGAITGCDNFDAFLSGSLSCIEPDSANECHFDTSLCSTSPLPVGNDPPCGVGQTLCVEEDGVTVYCSEVGDVGGCGENYLCDNDGLCDENEGCQCADCHAYHDTCDAELVCDFIDEVCEPCPGLTNFILNANNIEQGTCTYENIAPHIKITSPTPLQAFKVGDEVGFTIDFSGNERKDLNITWEFGDGKQEELVSCLKLNNDCGNIFHTYDAPGSYIVKVTAREIGGGNSGEDYVNILLYVGGMNVFAIITNPELGAVIDQGPVSFDASESFVANCLTGTVEECDVDAAANPSAGAVPEACYGVGDLWCYDFSEDKIGADKGEGAYDLLMDWVFDKDDVNWKKELSGMWGADYDAVVEFDRFFFLNIEHIADLTVTYGYYDGEVEECAGEGEYISTNVCCNDLVEIDNGFRYNLEDESADENGCISLEGAGTVCSDCGNEICEDGWEDQCNCPDDCLIVEE